MRTFVPISTGISSSPPSQTVQQAQVNPSPEPLERFLPPSVTSLAVENISFDMPEPLIPDAIAEENSTVPESVHIPPVQPISDERDDAVPPLQDNDNGVEEAHRSPQSAPVAEQQEHACPSWPPRAPSPSELPVLKLHSLSPTTEAEPPARGLQSNAASTSTREPQVVRYIIPARASSSQGTEWRRQRPLALRPRVASQGWQMISGLLSDIDTPKNTRSPGTAHLPALRQRANSIRRDTPASVLLPDIERDEDTIVWDIRG